MKKNDIFELEITDMGTDGEGIGHYDGMTFFVKDALIGDVITARATKLKKNSAKSKDFTEFWSEWGDSNSRHLAPKASALPTALHPVMEFSNCGQTCGQRRFLTSYRRWGKCCQPKCPNGFGVFRGLRPEPGPHAPKAGALPTALHPVMEFLTVVLHVVLAVF